MVDDSASRQYVSHGRSEALLASLEKLPGEPRRGFFGPGSVSWQVNGEAAVFLGAGRAALLQLAHPWVASALGHHSDLLNDALGRFHSTFRVVYTMQFGTRAQALAASRQLYRRHIGIRGELPSAAGGHPRGEHYEANEVAALRWVYATLVDSALLAREFTLGPLSPSMREQYFAESKRMAALFGIPGEALPEDWAEFARYFAETVASSELGVGADGLALGQSVLSGAGTSLHSPHWYRALTTFWMPPRLRSEFALPFSAPEEQAVHQAARLLPRFYRHMPRVLRFVGPLHEAEARLRGRSPGILTRASNRFWMGQPRMLYPQFSK